MQVRDIKSLPIAPHMPDDVKKLRKNAPRYIQSIIENTYAIREVKSLSELGQGSVSPLGGGMLSAAYWLQFDQDSRVIKLRYRGIDAEVKLMQAWDKVGASVVKVLAHGIIPQTRKSGEKIKYLILEGITDKKGEAAPICFDYVEEHPESTTRIGTVLGEELAKMHRATTTRSFGEFADMWGKNKSPLRTWNSYLQSFVVTKYDYYLSLGLTETKIKRLLTLIRNKKFPRLGVFVHGDYGLRNAMIISRNPIQVKIFDPNPIIGHPSWDLAISYNNFEFEKRKWEHKPHVKSYQKTFERDKNFLEGLKEGYIEESGKEIDEEAVFLSQLMQTTFLLEIEENKAKKHDLDPLKEIEVMVRKDTLFDKVERLVY